MRDIGNVQMIIAIGIAALVFFLFREVFMWYFKINTRVEEAKKQTVIMKDNNSLLRKLITLELEKKEPQKKPDN
jgi:hypothetical protein